MSDFEDNIKNLEETQYREVRVSTKTQREKMRALRDEFGFRPTTPQVLLDKSTEEQEVSEE